MKQGLLFAVAMVALAPSLCFADDSRPNTVTLNAGLVHVSADHDSGALLEMRTDETPAGGLMLDTKVGYTPNSVIGGFRLGKSTGQDTIEFTLAPEVTPVSWSYNVRLGSYLRNDSTGHIRVFMDGGVAGTMQRNTMSPGRGELSLGVLTSQQLNNIFSVDGLLEADPSGRHSSASLGLTAKLGENRNSYMRASISSERIRKPSSIIDDGSPDTLKNTMVGVSVGTAW